MKVRLGPEARLVMPSACRPSAPRRSGSSLLQGCFPATTDFSALTGRWALSLCLKPQARPVSPDASAVGRRTCAGRVSPAPLGSKAGAVTLRACATRSASLRRSRVGPRNIDNWTMPRSSHTRVSKPDRIHPTIPRNLSIALQTFNGESLKAIELAVA
jgi:hypothetical protein